MTEPRSTPQSTPAPSEGPTAHEAAVALHSAQNISIASTRDVETLKWALAGVGLAMALLLLLIRAAGSDLYVLAAGMIVYGLAVALILVFTLRVKAAPRGFARLYLWGFSATSALYVLSLIVITTADATQPRPWPLVAALALTTAAPALLLAHRIGRLAPR